MYFLGIDTSNYTTSASLICDGKVLVNAKRPVFVKKGEKGARQSDAVFSHVKNLPEVMSEIGAYPLTAIGVSVRPRDVENSYMPCFLAGNAVAASLASSMNLPLYTFSHQAGHVRAALYSSERGDLVDQRFLAFHVSGGTTEVLLYDAGKITCIGETLDINAGQLIDRVGLMLGLSFPCGPALDKLCDFELMRACQVFPMTKVKGLTCNLSGLENKAADHLNKGVPKEAVAAFVMASIEKTLSKLAANALDELGDSRLPIVFSGGVSSNSYLQRRLKDTFNAFFAESAFSADNAAGIALLCEERYLSTHDCR